MSGISDFPQPTRLRQVGKVHHLSTIDAGTLAAIIKSRLKDEAGNNPPKDLVESVIGQLILPETGAESTVLKSQINGLLIKQALGEIRKSRGLIPATPSQLVSLLSGRLLCDKGTRIHALGKAISIGRRRYYLTAIQPQSSARQKYGQGQIQPFLTLTRASAIKSNELGKADRFLVVKPQRQTTHH